MAYKNEKNIVCRAINFLKGAAQDPGEMELGDHDGQFFFAPLIVHKSSQHLVAGPAWHNRKGKLDLVMLHC